MSWEVFQRRSQAHRERLAISKDFCLIISAAAARGPFPFVAGDYISVLHDASTGAIAFAPSDSERGWKVRPNGGGLVVSCQRALRYLAGARGVGRYRLRRFDHAGDTVVGFVLGDQAS